MQEHRALILRSNRFLGSSLVDKGIVSSPDLESANEKFMAAIQSGDLRHASILTTLMFDLKVIDENQLIDFQVEELGLGLVDLDFVNLTSLRSWNVDLSLCWATSTLPFDKIEETYMIASCYYLSAPVIKQWEGLLQGDVIWFACSASSMTKALERVEEIRTAEDQAAEDDEEEEEGED